MTDITARETERVYWQQPIVDVVPPTKPAEPETKRLTFTEINDQIIEAQQEGFNEGAIVTRRRGTFDSARQPWHWGVVMYLARTHHDVNEPFKPLRIRWVNPAEGDNGTSLLHPDECLLIHPAPTFSHLRDFLECQDPPWQETKP